MPAGLCCQAIFEEPGINRPMMPSASQVQSCFANRMRKAALLYNPDSGGSRKRQRELASALEILRNAGVEANLFPTDSPEHADDEVRRAMATGYDTIFACGGDGTIHNMIQVMAKTPVALG